MMMGPRQGNEDGASATKRRWSRSNGMNTEPQRNDDGAAARERRRSLSHQTKMEARLLNEDRAEATK